MVNKTPVAESGAAASAAVFVAILVLFLHPIGGNELVYLPAARHFWQPEYLLNDWTFAGSGSEHFLFNAIVGGAMTILSMEVVGWIGRILVWGFLAHGLVRLGRVFGLPPMTAALAVILWLFLGQSVVGGEWMLPGFEAKTVAYVLLVYALLGAVESRVITAAILTGFCFSFHPSVGLQGGFALGVMVLAAGDRVQTFRFAGVAALCALPGLIPVLPLLGATTHADNQWQFLALVRMPWHLNPLRPGVWDQVLIAYGFLGFTWLHVRTRNGDTRSRSLLIFLVALAAIFTGGLVALILEQWTWLRIFPFRVYPLFATMFFAMSLFAAFRQWRTVRPPITLAVAGLILLLVLPNPVRRTAQVLTYCRLESEDGQCQAWGQEPDDVAKAFEWISANTPKGSVAILPPWRKDSWYLSERAQVAGWHYMPYGRVREWRERIESIVGPMNDTDPVQGSPNWMKERYLEMTPGQIETISRRHGADYLVSRSEYGWPVVFRSGEWEVYELR